MKNKLKEILKDLSKLHTDLYMGEDVYNGKDGENRKYNIQIENIINKIRKLIND